MNNNNNFKLSTAEFKGNVIAQLSEIRGDLTTIREFIESNSIRITSLEMWRSNLMGKITLAVGIFSLAFTCLWQWILKKFVNPN